MAEAAWSRDRDALSKAGVVGIFRDERRGHLLLRAMCIGTDQDAVRHWRDRGFSREFPCLAESGRPIVGTALLLNLGVALAFLVSVSFEDRTIGFGAAILLWLLAAVVYDGILLLLVASLGRYPLERPLLILTLLNPIDIGRILMLL